MEYAETRVGRVFVVKFEHGEDLRAKLHSFCAEKDIRAGSIQLLGAIKATTMVAGPKNASIPPEPVWKTLNAPHELMALGTIARDMEMKPAIHIHAVTARHSDTLMGCLRDITEVFLVVEAVIIEFSDIVLVRRYDKRYAMALLSLTDTTED